MELFAEAGIFSLFSLGLFVVGLALTVRGRSRAAQIAPGFCAGIMGLSMLGSGLGQRLVDRAVSGVPELSQKVAYLSAGTREAQANMILAGAMVVLLLGIAAAVTVLSPKDG